MASGSRSIVAPSTVPGGCSAELVAAFDHYRSALPAAGFDVVTEFLDGEDAEVYGTGHGLECSIRTDIAMDSVWINASCFPELGDW